MKTRLLLFTLLSFTFSYAQTNHYEDLFSKPYSLGGPSGEDASTAYGTDQLAFQYSVSHRMQALLVMYESTNDVSYLETFIKNANRTLNRRDNNRVGSLAATPMSDIIAYDDEKHSTWSTRYYNKACPRFAGYDGDANWHKDTVEKNYLTCPQCKDVPHLVGNANIIYAFVKFYNIIKDNPSLEILEFDSFGKLENEEEVTYLTISDKLLDAAKETYTYYNAFWELDPSDSTKGYYREHLGDDIDDVLLEFKGAKLPLNMQAGMGRVLVQLYLATGDMSYFNRIKELANYIKSHTNLVNNAKQWTYWGYEDPLINAVRDGFSADLIDSTRLKKPLREDISHAALTVAFPYECFDAGFTSIYNATDIDEYANTLLNDIYIDVLQFDDGVHNGHETNNTWNFKTNTNTHPVPSSGPVTVAPNGYLYDFWMLYSGVRPEIYQILNDFNTSKFYPTTGSTTNFSRNFQRPLTVAYLRAYQKLFAPIASEHTFSTTINWAGVAAGNFDDDLLNGDEFVFVNREDGELRIGRLDSENGIDDDHFTPLSYGANFDWGNIAAGDLFGDDTDEIIAVSNQVGESGYHIFSVSGTTITPVTTSTGWGPSSDWVGAAAGDFIAGGHDDFVLVRNHNLELKLGSYDVSPNPSTYLASLITTPMIPTTATIIGVAAGNIIDDIPGDELVVLVNSPNNTTNGFYVLSLNQTTKKFEEVINKTGWGVSSDFQAITVGDYDGDGKDNILIHRNFDSEYKVFHVNGNITVGYTIDRLSLTDYEFFDISQTDGNILGSGNFDINSANNDELISLRNTDGGIIVYTYADRVVTTPRATNSNTDVLFKNPQEITSSDDIKIYPNPTSTSLTINSKNEISSIIIHNLLGENIKLTVKNNVLDVSSLSNGIYILRITFTNGKIVNKKIIKN